jgi:uncharacterized membrane protein YuzA (DUF378 family)
MSMILAIICLAFFTVCATNYCLIGIAHELKLLRQLLEQFKNTDNVTCTQNNEKANLKP